MAICLVEFDPEFPTAMKRIPRAFYRPARKRWIAPKDRRAWQALKDVFGTENIIMERAPALPAARYEAAVTALEQCLMPRRYSWRTVKAYKNCFRQSIRHYDDIKPGQITRKQIDACAAGLIQEKSISKSHQNDTQRDQDVLCEMIYATFRNYLATKVVRLWRYTPVLPEKASAK